MRWTMGQHERIIQAIKDTPIRGLGNLYRLILDYCNGDEKIADEFCLSNRGGFTPFELSRVKYQRGYQRERYQQSK